VKQDNPPSFDTSLLLASKITNFLHFHFGFIHFLRFLFLGNFAVIKWEEACCW
jgi:hypothetical protein